MKIIIDNPKLTYEECSILEDIEKLYNETTNITIKGYLSEMLKLFLSELSRKYNLKVEEMIDNDIT
jgi:hypothetical protein